MLPYLSFVFTPMYLQCSFDVPPMYLLFLSVYSTFPSCFLPICSSIYYRTSIGQQSNIKRTSIEQKIGILRSYSLATCFLPYTYLPTLSDSDAHVLATGYDFSGGQIENISRKATINAILNGEETNDLVKLTSYCKSEQLDGANTGRRIGF